MCSRHPSNRFGDSTGIGVALVLFWAAAQLLFLRQISPDIPADIVGEEFRLFSLHNLPERSYARYTDKGIMRNRST
jgi:hypothetical protein